MTRRTAIVFPVFVILMVSHSPAKDFWEDPYTRWDKKDVVRMINDSPWAQIQTFSRGLERNLEQSVGGAGVGVSGDREIYNKFTVRFFSALPVREAYVRMFQIANNYDEATPEQKAEFDQRFNRALNLDVADRVILAVEFASNEPQTNRDMKQFFDLATAETLKQSVYLISQRLGRVQLKEYYPPSPDGTGAKFVFPRTVDGQAVLAPSDKEARLEFYLPVINQKLFIKFRVDRMVHQGALSY
ncbi:MAG: hypothetical protein HYS33_02595 [Acidobacteria bacterium]|nr:hypothetical protein [Acidobacteriota bacterium]